MLEETADKPGGVEVGGAQPGTSRFTVGEGNGAVLERDDAAIGDGDFEDIGGEVLQRRVAVGVGSTVDVPGDVPGLRVDLFKKPGFGHLLLEDGAVDG